jgi:hypothetical protein
MEGLLQNQLCRIDANIAELQRLLIEQNELRVLHLRRSSDTAEDDARCHELHISLKAMKRSREAIVKLSEHDEADYYSLPSNII